MLSRIRITAALLVLAVLAVFAVPRTVVHHDAPAVASALTLPSHAPAPAPLPFDVVAFSAIAGATVRSKKNKNLIVDSVIHVARKHTDEGTGRTSMMTVAIQPGTLVDDTDLTDEEIDENFVRKAVRYATADELERLERVAADKAAAKAAAGADHETAAINAEGESERQRIIAEAEADKQKKLAALDEKLEKDRQDAASKAAEDAKKSGGKKAGKPSTPVAPVAPIVGANSTATDQGSESARAAALGGTASGTDAPQS